MCGKWKGWKHDIRFSDNSDCEISWDSENGQSFVESAFIDHNG